MKAAQEEMKFAEAGRENNSKIRRNGTEKLST